MLDRDSAKAATRSPFNRKSSRKGGKKKIRRTRALYHEIGADECKSSTRASRPRTFWRQEDKSVRQASVGSTNIKQQPAVFCQYVCSTATVSYQKDCLMKGIDPDHYISSAIERANFLLDDISQEM